jgi:hypothetical protein
MFNNREILKEWQNSTDKIRAGNGGRVTPDMCERVVTEITTKREPFKHAFLMLAIARKELLKNPAQMVLRLVKKQGGEV